ncbi:MATE family efflux transporter [Clostridium sp. P21]|uniref:Probable multidrug resistance protein NorM n=2 Tax=Clostridium muellerianum TaxID=2716538 RepID=A0A7Y0HMY6_9CLOT|nr:MATE family efflux transporter [Clostridium muellerianum]
MPLAIPVIIENIFQALLGTIDTYFVGKLSSNAIAAVGITNLIMNIYIGFFTAVGIGTTSIVSRNIGLATTLARIISVIMLFTSVCRDKTIIKLNLFSKWIINKKLLISIGKIGIPAGIEKLIMRFGQLVYGAMIIDLGTSAYVAHNIAGTIESYSYLPAMGFGIAAATLMGNNLGANKPEKAKKYVLAANTLSTIFMVIIGVFFYTMSPSLAKLFTSDKQVQQLVVSVLRIIALFQPFLSLTMVISSTLQGAGDTKFSMYSTFFGIWVIRVGVGYLFGVIFNFGLVGSWLAYSLDISIRGIILLLRFLNNKWRNIKIS